MGRGTYLKGKLILELIANVRCNLGEGIFYAPPSLYWFDIKCMRLYILNDNKVKSMALKEQFSAGAVVEAGKLLLLSETGLWVYNEESKFITKLVDVEANNPNTRSNDGRVDQHGGFWFGTMGKNAEPSMGRLYRFYKGRVTMLLSDISIPNAICFSPTKDYAFFADSAKQTIYRWILNVDGWPVGNPERWVTLEEIGVTPDGAVMDEEGFMWNAHWGGGRLVRYSPQGAVDKKIHLPVSRPTCPAFWGGDRGNLAITSAREELDCKQIKREPTAGGVYSVKLEVPGLIEPGVILHGN